MKPAYIFRDRINTVVQWFDQWNDIEQTIACYSLLKRLGPTQARFLSLVLEHTFQDSAYEVQIFEEEANAKGNDNINFYNFCSYALELSLCKALSYGA